MKQDHEPPPRAKTPFGGDRLQGCLQSRSLHVPHTTNPAQPPYPNQTSPKHRNFAAAHAQEHQESKLTLNKRKDASKSAQRLTDHVQYKATTTHLWVWECRGEGKPLARATEPEKK